MISGCGRIRLIFRIEGSVVEQYWTPRDGREIAVGDMTEQHAKNVLRKLIREGVYADPYYGKAGPDEGDRWSVF